MASTNCTLVVTKDSNLSIAIVVKLDLLLNTDVAVGELLQKCGHSERGVVCTEDLGTEARHVVGQVFVELASL